MRKIIFLLSFLFLLSGCSNSVSVTPQEVAEKYKQDFSASVSAVFGENEAELDIVKNSMSMLAMNYLMCMEDILMRKNKHTRTAKKFLKKLDGNLSHHME